MSMASQISLNIDVISLISSASRVFKAESLARMIYKVFFIDHFLTTQPDFGLTQALTFDEEGLKRARQEVGLVFDLPGQSKPISSARPLPKLPWLIPCRRKYPRLW